MSLVHAQNTLVYGSVSWGGNTELEMHKMGFITESLVLFAFTVGVSIWAGIAVYLFLLPVPPDKPIPAFVLCLISK